MMKFWWVATVFFLLKIAVANKCPPRSSIYPCTCQNVEISTRNSLSIGTCVRIPDTNSLAAGLDSMRGLHQLSIYDSFWDVEDDSEKVLPSNWIVQLSAQELSISDSSLSPCFACGWTTNNCINSEIKKLSIVNSSSSDRICFTCTVPSGSHSSWTSCMPNLTEFRFEQNGLTSVPNDMFPLAMRNLKILVLARNKITKVDTNSFRNVPNLQTLDLSRNMIEDIDHALSPLSKLQVLNISFNRLRQVGMMIHRLPQLRVLDASDNYIVEMRLGDWVNNSSKELPESLRVINLQGNSIRCDCGVRWIKSTFPVGTQLQGKCATPEYSSSTFRSASRSLTERCDSHGQLTRSRPKKSNKKPKSTEVPTISTNHKKH